MHQLHNQILTVAQMRAAEEHLIARGIGVDELMQRAGRGAGEYVRRIAAGRSVTVLCGPGNNGGDGYVIAEFLREHGNAVRVIAAREPGTDAAKPARALYGGEVFGPESRVRGDVFVDCLFGSGLTRGLPDDLFRLFRELCSSHHHRIAIDLPSGIESDSGQPLNPGLPVFDLTLALGAWKFAHWSLPASATMGILRLVPIGCEAVPGAALALDDPRISAPPVDAHKYTRGLLAIVGGAMPGATLLSAEAALRSGAGYVKLLADQRPEGTPPELVCETAPLAVALADRRIAAVLIGPGLGRDPAARARLEAVLERGVPTVVDADALTLLRPGDRGTLILTPHEGEMGSLEKAFGLAAGGPRHDRAKALAAATGAVVVLKGPHTIVAAPDGAVDISRRASPWLSVAGSGDVLAGMIASRLAFGRDALDDAKEGVWLHCEAARLAGPAFTAGELARQAGNALLAALG